MRDFDAEIEAHALANSPVDALRLLIDLDPRQEQELRDVCEAKTEYPGRVVRVTVSDSTGKLGDQLA